MSFHPDRVRPGDWLQSAQDWTVVSLGGTRRLALPADSLGFTVCQVPVIYRRRASGLEIVLSDGSSESVSGTACRAIWHGQSSPATAGWTRSGWSDPCEGRG